MKFIHEHQSPSHLTWTLSRPERGNALGPTVARELLAAVHGLRDRHEKPRALIITAQPVVNGDRRTWIAGGDLKELAELAGPADARAYVTLLADTITALEELPIPVIMAVDGAAIGGGAELALAGDLRLATTSSSYDFRQLKAGLATGYGSARRLVELLGLSRSQGLLYLCRDLKAAEAESIGLVHEVVADAQALKQACDQLCQALAMLDPMAIAAQKRMLWHAVGGPGARGRAAELELFASLWRGPGHQAFLDRFASGAATGNTRKPEARQP